MKCNIYSPRPVNTILLIFGCILFFISFFLPRPIIETNDDSTIGVWTYSMDLGGGLIFLALSMKILINLFSIKEWKDFLYVKALSKGKLFALSIIASLCQYPSIIWYYSMRGMRGDYPPNQDSIGIAIFFSFSSHTFFMILMSFIIIILFFWCKLPTTLGIKTCPKTIIHKFLEIFIGIIIFLYTLILLFSIIDGDHLCIPIYITYIYIFLSIKAGINNYQNNKFQTYGKQPTSAQ